MPQQPTIHILIRTHRPALLERAIASVHSCDYHNVVTHIADGTGMGDDYKYNDLCNTMKASINDGYMIFLDDDDTIIPGSLNKVAPYLLPDRALICQMLRAGRPKPKRSEIRRGHIGLPCMILHHSHKHLADVTQHEGGDYDWIKGVTNKLPWKFVPVAVVNAERRSYGK